MKPDYKILNIPEDSIWDRKTYNPYVLLDRWVYNKFRHTIIGGYLCRMFDGINAFVRGVKNIVKWAPTIYKDNDWDYTSIYTIMQKKIEFNRNLIVKPIKEVFYLGHIPPICEIPTMNEDITTRQLTC